MNVDVSFDYTKKVEWSFDTIINKISFALSKEDFSLLSKLDIKRKIKERLDKDIEDYIILWACNPDLAYEIISHEIKVWLLLPCNVILYKKFWETFVSIIRPSVFSSIVKNPEVEKITKLADKKLKRVIDNI